MDICGNERLENTHTHRQTTSLSSFWVSYLLLGMGPTIQCAYVDENFKEKKAVSAETADKYFGTLERLERCSLWNSHSLLSSVSN